ncbi:MAG: helix-turn-helix transcriptional regulator [Bdellovibrionota bacterium]
MNSLQSVMSELRREMGLSQKAFARWLGVSRMAVWRWEKGEAADLSMKTTQAIQRTLRLSDREMADCFIRRVRPLKFRKAWANSFRKNGVQSSRH